MTTDTMSLNSDAARPPSREWWLVLGFLTVATVAGVLLDRYVSLTSQAMLYVLAVAIASYKLGWVPSVVCAVAAVTLLNFFFIPPRYTFFIEAQENLFALLAMLTVALAISHLGTGLRREAGAARVNERRARQLQELATELAVTTLPAEVQLLAQRSLGRALPGPCVVALLTPAGELNLPKESVASLRDGMLACIREAATLGPGTGRWPGLNAWYVPLRAETHTAGAACIQNVSAADNDGREHARAICALAGQALWRLKLSATVHEAEERSQWQHAQNTFLAAISHDFRTPLATMLGAASSLRTQRDKLAATEQDRLLASIEREARHLATLTDNTLQLVRLDHTGELRTDWQSMEEIVGSVLARVRDRDVAHRIRSNVPANLPLIKADSVLLAQLLENLLDNALKYSSDPIELEVRHRDQRMEVAVHDRGNGIAAGEELAIFEPYRRSDRSGQRGAGLGLAVCRAIARAHNGELSVRARDGGGSTFVLSLPMESAQPLPEGA